MKKKLTISAKKLDKLFDEGADMTPYFDFDNPMSWDEFLEKHKIGIKQKRMNLDLPEWIMQKVDIQAERFGMARQALIRSWILEKLGISTAVKPTSA